MFLIFKLAYRNLVSRGLRTWLNVFILSFSYVLIIAHQGMFSGMLKQGLHDMIKDDVAGGHYWCKNYDPFDPITLPDAHAVIPDKLKTLITNTQATPVLLRPATIYPEGRMQSIILRGVDPDQNILGLPTLILKNQTTMGSIPILIGRRMAKKNSLKIGDTIIIRLRDANGTFDAVEAEIVNIMKTRVPTIDKGNIWLSLDDLQNLTNLNDQATMIVLSKDFKEFDQIDNWTYKSQAFLVKDITDMVKSKRVGGAIMYAILLFLALLAVFDTQVLSIFKRKKEIGILMALGMRRIKVIVLFTLEGMLNGLLAVIMGAIYGVPLLILFARHGYRMPEVIESYGMAIATTLYPTYSALLVLGTIIIVMITVTIVSFIPTRKIAKLKPTEALRGR